VTATRSNSNPAREAAAAATRARLIAAAGEILREGKGLSLDAVATRAGVTRLTVYNQFGSRHGLLEAVFDDRAAAGGLGRIGQAMAVADPREALRRIVAIFCDFWSGDGAVRGLHDAIAHDPEFAAALAARGERRRGTVGTLIARMELPGDQSVLTDTVTALTSQGFFTQLSDRRGPADAARIVNDLVDAAVDCAGRIQRD
jgi:AcrR family transcriptional regulator